MRGLGAGEWGIGNGGAGEAGGDEGTRRQGENLQPLFPNAQCPIPYASSPISGDAEK
jgi:hypothetical protein